MTIIDFPTTPDTGELETETSALVAQARSLQILTPEDYTNAAGFLQSVVNSMEKKVVEFFAPLKKAAHDAHKKLTQAEADQLRPISEAKATIKRNMMAWREEQDRLDYEAEMRRRAEAKRIEEERQLQEALDAEAEGDHEAAEAIIAAPIAEVVVAKVVTMPKVSGIAYRETWKAIVDDKMALIRFVAARPEYQHLLDPNMTAINGIARSQKDAARIDGVRIYAEKSVAAGSR